MGVLLIRAQSVSRMIQFRIESEPELSPIGRRPSATKHLQNRVCIHGDIVYPKRRVRQYLNMTTKYLIVCKHI